jgi:hypothetical protein
MTAVIGRRVHSLNSLAEALLEGGDAQKFPESHLAERGG